MGEECGKRRLSFDGTNPDQDLIVPIVKVELFAAEFRTDQTLKTGGGG